MKWNNNLAYAVGLMVTDGSLSKDGRHLDFTSKDMEQLNNFKRCLNLNVKISFKSSGYNRKKKYTHVQFGDVKLYKWLESIGLMPNKTKIISVIEVPDEYFFDFLRGHLDGDGSTYSYWDKRWRSSYLVYLQFTSASIDHIHWLRSKIKQLLGIKGHVSTAKSMSTYNLRFAKYESIKIFKKMYNNKNAIYLKRKFLKIQESLGIINQ